MALNKRTAEAGQPVEAGRRSEATGKQAEGLWEGTK